MNKHCVVYQDGKSCRDVPGRIIKEESRRILITFTIEQWDGDDDKWEFIELTKWFTRRRRDNGGVYECHEYNYWYYRNT